MIYLLDVNALIGLGFREHGFHARMEKWLRSASGHSFATCSITELGFVRILPQHPEFDVTVEQACERLNLLKAALAARLIFLNDNVSVVKLPRWVKHPRQTTDGHLVVLAKEHGALLATCDQKIPGSFLIPA